MNGRQQASQVNVAGDRKLEAACEIRRPRPPRRTRPGGGFSRPFVTSLRPVVPDE